MYSVTPIVYKAIQRSAFKYNVEGIETYLGYSLRASGCPSRVLIARTRGSEYREDVCVNL